MADNGSTVSLKFVGDDAQLQKTFKGVQAGSEKMTTGLKHAELGAKHLADGLESATKHGRGTADVIDGLSAVMGQNATTALYMTRGIADLTDGMGVLIPKAKELAGSLTLGKVAFGGIIAAIATAGVAVAANIDHTSMLNEVNRTAADTVDTLTGSVQFLTQGIPGLNSLMDKARGVTRGWSDDAHGLGVEWDVTKDKIIQAARAQALFQAPDTNPGGDAIFTTADAQNIAIQAYKDQSGATLAEYYASLPKKAASASSSATSSALDAAAQAAKQKLAKFQQIADQYSQIAKGIAESFAPKLQAADANTLILSGSKGGILAALRKQLDDTKKLKRDLELLAKKHLDPKLLSSLVAGGLDSLPAAEEILNGGSAYIADVNSTAGAINRAGNSIAGAETAREVRGQDKPMRLEIDLKNASTGDFEKFLAKLFVTKGAKAFGLRAA